MVSATIDHLVIAAYTLDEGIDYICQVLGVSPQTGGKHTRMGTHNALLGLGDSLYLEIIAIDPAGSTPDHPRWFNLDALQATLRHGPRLIHWVARTDELENLVSRCPVALGEIQTMTRGDLAWRITIPADGHMPGDGLIPTLIQWQSSVHPASRLTDQGCSLARLEGFYPQPETIQPALVSLGLADTITIQPSAAGQLSHLVAHIRTPNGVKMIAPSLK